MEPQAIAKTTQYLNLQHLRYDTTGINAARQATRQEPYPVSLFQFIDRLISEASNKRTLQSLRRSLQTFMCGADIMLAAVDSRFILRYSAYLQERVSAATVSFYMRALRSVMNHAQGDGLCHLRFDWAARVNISVDRSQRNAQSNALASDTLRQIAGLTLSGYTAFVRDMFLFCFYAQGLELVDLAGLKTADFDGHTLSYRRRSKGKRTTVALGPKALDIIDRYSDPALGYLFPILRTERKDYTFAYIRDKFARAMKEISHSMPLPIPLTFGMSRYSWLAMSRNINVSEQLI